MLKERKIKEWLKVALLNRAISTSNLKEVLYNYEQYVIGEEKENIPPNSSVDNSIKENNNIVRNYSKETFDDRRVVAESFFDNF